MEKSSKLTLAVAISISLFLTLLVIWSFQSAKRRSGTIILPGGITYLGPTPAQSPELRAQSSEPVVVIPSDAKWVTYQGKKFPYSFSYPETLSLGVFPDDPFDSVTVFLPNTNAQENLFFRVKNLTDTQYVGKPMEYVENWWRGYNWKGLSSVTKFTNSHGLVGYRAKYIDNQGQTPYDHVFFEVPGKPDLLLWLSGKLFTKDAFDRLIDSVSWLPQ